MLKLSSETIKVIERMVGADYATIQGWSPEEEQTFVESKTGRKLQYARPEQTPTLIPRGNIYLASGRYASTEEDLLNS